MERYLLNARDPLRVSFSHREYDQVEEGTITPLENMVHRFFFFGPNEVSTLRRLLPHHLRQCSRFELLAACLWRCRTIAIKPDPDEEVRLLCMLNAHSKFKPPLSSGYYGNTVVFPAAITTAKKLCWNPLGYAVELVKQAKESVIEESVKSTAESKAINGRPYYPLAGSCIISDVTRARFEDVEFGWGKAVYGGLAKCGLGAKLPGAFTASLLMAIKNKNGEVGVVMTIGLPALTMERFAKELDGIFFISSAL